MVKKLRPSGHQMSEIKNNSGFDILEIDWLNGNEFIIELKLIDEPGIYRGICKLDILKTKEGSN